MSLNHELTGQCKACFRHAFETIGGLCAPCITDDIGRKTELEVVSRDQGILFETGEVTELDESLVEASDAISDLREGIEGRLDNLRADIDAGETLDKIPPQLKAMADDWGDAFGNIEKVLSDARDLLDCALKGY